MCTELEPLRQALGFVALSAMTLLLHSAWHPVVPMSSVNTMESHHVIITWAACLPNSLVIVYPRSPKTCIHLSHVSFLQFHQQCLKAHAGHTIVTQCEVIALAVQPYYVNIHPLQSAAFWRKGWGWSWTPQYLFLCTLFSEVMINLGC